MARKKSQIAEISANESTDQSADALSKLLSLMENLSDRISKLEQGKPPDRQGVLENKKENVSDFVVDEDEFEQIEINSYAYIKVMSLTPFMLTLSTKGRGRGKLYSFPEFGTVKRIQYSDLVDIMESHQNFLNNFNFIVLDKRVIKRHGLGEMYAKALSKEKIEQILNGSSVSDAFSLFASANKSQQEFIVEMMIHKLTVDPESIDLNLVDKIARVSGIKIMEKADEARTLLEMLKEE
jgi:hypothetical protein